MMKKPPSIVGDREDRAGSEFVHDRTVGRHEERYKEVWSSGYATTVVSSEAEALREASHRKAKQVKLKYVPGKERYARNEHEPISI